MRVITPRETWTLIRCTVEKFSKESPIIYAAAIAFFTIFSLPSILVIVISVAGLFLDQSAIKGELNTQVQDLIGRESAQQIQAVIENANQTGSGVVASIVGLGTLLFSATVIFNFIQQGLNALWGVKPKPRRGIVKFGIDRLTSFAIIIGLAFLMMVSLLLDTMLSFFRQLISTYLSGGTVYLMQALNTLVSIGITVIIFAAIFKVLPDVKIKWRDVWVGAIVTALLFEVGKFVIGIMLSNIGITATYGAAGAFVSILLWVFYSSLIVLFGASFTQVWISERGHQIQPTHNSVKVVSKEVEIHDEQEHEEVEEELEKAAKKAPHHPKNKT
ncbi:membrane protein [Catalinimonas alkaloidigena]|uniref:Membrane protein n=1 Tax=Catalinimonas alkaloidigena TaxID=1075417 RepID=A0A1G9JFF5_9BACT|nr:YihY/virulence factor BrkB family protein [Catalinimonas alkaloidigena]SDL36309.1 membrane protein [Catalinimonas alkaloidigena]